MTSIKLQWSKDNELTFRWAILHTTICFSYLEWFFFFKQCFSDCILVWQPWQIWRQQVILVVYRHLHGQTGLVTLWANGKQNSKLVNFVAESRLPFALARYNYRKTTSKVWNWYQRWLWWATEHELPSGRTGGFPFDLNFQKFGNGGQCNGNLPEKSENRWISEMRTFQPNVLKISGANWIDARLSSFLKMLFHSLLEILESSNREFWLNGKRPGPGCFNVGKRYPPDKSCTIQRMA